MFSVSTGWVSDRECQIGPQKDLPREDRNADTGDPIAGNYRGRKKTIHQFGKLKILVYISFPLQEQEICTTVQYFGVIFELYFFKISLSKSALSYQVRGPFLESPGNFSGP